jgi:hypothetical protein
VPIPSISVGWIINRTALKLGILTLSLHAFDLRIGPDSRQYRAIADFDKCGTFSMRATARVLRAFSEISLTLTQSILILLHCNTNNGALPWVGTAGLRTRVP